MGPAFPNEYEARCDYYDEWLKEQLNGEEIPPDREARHRLLIKLREEAFDRLCDVVYQEKGFTSEAIPLPETLEKFGLLDERARNLLTSLGVVGKYSLRRVVGS
jgi:aldehyde:ferredoxin oxidoreductase